MFESLLSSMLQCICDLWDAADSPTKKKLLIQELRELLERLTKLNELPAPTSIAPPRQLKGDTDPALSSVAVQAREILSVILGAVGLLEKYEPQLTPERRAEEFGKIRDAIQDFARLLDEVTI